MGREASRSEEPADEQRWLHCVERAQRGDGEAWRELLAEHEGMLRVLVQSRAPLPGASAEDLHQEVCQAIVQQLPGFTPRSLPEWRGWLREVAEHRLTDLWRRRSAEKRAAEPAPGLESEMPGRRVDGREATTPSRAAMRNEEDDSRGETRPGGFALTPRVRAALERLEPRERTLLVEVRLKGRPVEEVMREVGLTVYTSATSALARAVKRFSDALQER